MDYLDGIKITNVEELRALGIDTAAIAEALIDIYNVTILRHGMFHADPHPGNLFVLPPKDGEPARIGLVDFGLTKRLPDEFRQQVVVLTSAIIAQHRAEISTAMEDMGFRTRVRDDETYYELGEAFLGRRAALRPRLRGPAALRGTSTCDWAACCAPTRSSRCPGDVVLIARVMGLLSGIGRSLDSETDLMDAILPYLEEESASPTQTTTVATRSAPRTGCHSAVGDLCLHSYGDRHAYGKAEHVADWMPGVERIETAAMGRGDHAARRHVARHAGLAGDDDPLGRASARGSRASPTHVTIGRDGRIVQHVPIRRQAWHAGRLDPGAPPQWSLLPPGANPNDPRDRHRARGLQRRAVAGAAGRSHHPRPPMAVRRAWPPAVREETVIGHWHDRAGIARRRSGAHVAPATASSMCCATRRTSTPPRCSRAPTYERAALRAYLGVRARTPTVVREDERWQYIEIRRPQPAAEGAATSV